MREKGKIMGKVKGLIMEIEEFVWDYFDEDGNFTPDETIKDKDELISVLENNYGYMGADIAKQEIFNIETGDHFSQGHPIYG